MKTLTMQLTAEELHRIEKAAKIGGCRKRDSASFAKEFLLINVAAALRTSRGRRPGRPAVR